MLKKKKNSDKRIIYISRTYYDGSWNTFHGSSKIGPEIIIKPDDIIYVQRGSSIGKVTIIPTDSDEMTINPQFVHFSKYLNDDIVKDISWTFWNSMRYLFGTDENGDAGRAWDNTGIQYGLNGLKTGLLDMQTFMNINRFIVFF